MLREHLGRRLGTEQAGRSELIGQDRRIDRRRDAEPRAQRVGRIDRLVRSPRELRREVCAQVAAGGKAHRPDPRRIDVEPRSLVRDQPHCALHISQGRRPPKPSRRTESGN